MGGRAFRPSQRRPMPGGAETLPYPARRSAAGYPQACWLGQRATFSPADTPHVRNPCEGNPVTQSPPPVAADDPGATPPDRRLTTGEPEVAVVHTQAAADPTDAHPADKEGALHAEIAALHTEVSELHTEVASFPAELQALQDEIHNLDLALESNRNISAAVGIIMERLRLTQQDAFQVLVKTSQARRIKLRQVADEIVETGSLPPALPTPTADSHS